MIEHAQSLGAPEIAVPRKIVMVAEIPVLETGKTDYVTIQRLAAADGRRTA
jgi:acyl-[acyl-carrier-protein]-phospholipid O-acyltransferase / long-chain-fatty-acid--[acyl-carrier-protein] ligase